MGSFVMLPESFGLYEKQLFVHAYKIYRIYLKAPYPSKIGIFYPRKI